MTYAHLAFICLTQTDETDEGLRYVTAAENVESDSNEWLKTLIETLTHSGASDARMAVHQHRVTTAESSNIVERVYQYIAAAQSLSHPFHDVVEQAATRFPKDIRLKKEFGMSAEQAGYSGKAEDVYREILDEYGLEVDALRGLRRIYLGKQNYDAAWCLCRALCELGQANQDEEMFFNQYATQSPTRATSTLHNAHWALIDHPFLHGPMDELFEIAYEALVSCLGLKQKSLAIKPKRDAVELTDPDPFVRIISYLYEALPIPSMTVYRSDRTALLRPVLTQPPSLLIAREHPTHSDPFRTIFSCARRIARSRPSQLIAGTYSDHTERFKSMLLLLNTLLAFTGHGDSTVKNYDKRLLSGLEKNVKEPVRQRMTQVAETVVAQKADIKKWLAGVELTADRVGFVLANHLHAAIETISDQAEGIHLLSAQDRIAALRQFAVSENYIQIRRLIGHHID